MRREGPLPKIWRPQSEGKGLLMERKSTEPLPKGKKKKTPGVSTRSFDDPQNIC